MKPRQGTITCVNLTDVGILVNTFAMVLTAYQHLERYCRLGWQFIPCIT